jgi:hypothetical protein
VDESGERQPRRAVRLLLLGAGAGLLWAGFSVFTQIGTAHADDTDLGGGLVGIVSDVTSGASDAVGSLTDTVAEIVPPIAPVTDAASTVTTHVTTAMSHTVDAVPEVIPEVAPVVAPVVTEVVQPIVDEVAQPVVDTVAELTAPVPVVGAVVGAVDLSGTVAAVPGVVTAVDGVVDTVVTGSPASSPIDALPVEEFLPGAPGLAVDAADASRFALLAATSSVSAGAPGVRQPALSVPRSGEPASPEYAVPDAPETTAHAGPGGAHDRGPLSRPSAPSPASGAGSAASPTAEALLAAAAHVGRLDSSVAPLAVSDRVPACPVYEADTSPD